jgi:uncharacterized spore protein YtfJ
MQLEDIFEKIKDLQTKADVNAVYGEPVTLEGRTIIPVASVKYAFGFGYSEGPTERDEAEEDEDGDRDGGFGGGVAAHAVAVLEITEEGVVVKPVEDETKVAMAGILTGVWAIFWLAKIIIAIFGKK